MRDLARSPGSTDGPLTGLRVLDCGTVLAAPMVCQILGDFGAEVIKIEHPTQPDSMRGHGPAIDGQGIWWTEVARNKRPITLNLSDPDGADVLLQLVRTSDVLVENFRPGTLERWGLGWDVLSAANPGLVMLRVTGFGQSGPYSDRPAFGTLIEAMSGFASMTGETGGPPTLPPFGLADSVAAMAGVGAVMMALYHRDASGGTGQVIDLSLLEPLMTATGPGPSVFDKLGIVGERQGNRSSNNSPRNLYVSSDGAWIAVSTSAESIARRVLTLVGHPEIIDESWFATGAGRASHSETLDDYVGSWIRERPSQEVIDAFEAVGAAAAAVYTAADLVRDPQVEHLNMFVPVEDEQIGRVLQHNVLFRLADTPGRIRFSGRAHGVDTDAVLRELGLDEAHVAQLRTKGVVK